MTSSQSISSQPAPTAVAEDYLNPVFFLAATHPAAMKAMNAELIAGFAPQAVSWGGAFEGVPLLLLTTRGARSGLPRTTPVNYTRAAGGYVVLASKSGAPRHPYWYHNLLAHPDATVEVGGATLAVRARVTCDTERQRLFDRHITALPTFAVYQNRTTRQLPVVVLEPVAYAFPSP